MNNRHPAAQHDNRQTMTAYYRIHSHFYDATRWTFLYGRRRLVEQLNIVRGERVIEIGCGTGANFASIQERLGNTGELIGVDCSAPMLRKAAERVGKNKWTNVRLLDLEYGKETITRGRADVVLFSYSLSMITNWELALACAHSELWPGGRIGVLDFCKSANSSDLFAEWLALNHVQANRPYQNKLSRLFQEHSHMRYDAWAGLWSFYLYTGSKRQVPSSGRLPQYICE
jgi:S-adenosylmethionine-diacylgycerolhomoserine-N-methlytransferase